MTGSISKEEPSRPIKRKTKLKIEGDEVSQEAVCGITKEIGSEKEAEWVREEHGWSGMGGGLKVIAGWVHEKVSVQVLKLASILGFIWIIGMARIR